MTQDNSTTGSSKIRGLVFCIITVVVAAAVAILFYPDDEAFLNDPSRQAILSTEKNIYSQTGEEVIIRDFFQDKKGGVFVDVGSAHYRLHSTTYYLEHHLEWSGVAIDALERYRADYEKHRSRTTFFSYYVSDESDKEEVFYQLDKNLLMSTGNKSRAEKFGQGGTTETKIKTITLNDLLDRMGIQKIDLLSMDIEDAEPAALAGFDIQRFRPELVCIEAHHTIQKELRAYFKKHDYVRIEKYSEMHGGLNWYFMPKPE